jgi:hypothetical protein
MEIIGFVVVMLLGLGLVFGSALLAWTTLVFMGCFERRDVVWTVGILVAGLATLYFGVTHSPFHVTLA